MRESGAHRSCVPHGVAQIPDKTADMAKANPLQEQLLKAGLVKKSKVAEVAREQHKARHGKGPSQRSDIQRDAERARAEKAERDRALAAERKHKARIAELASQARQIIEDKKVPRSGELEYRFTDGDIRPLLINESLRRQLASGALVIARPASTEKRRVGKRCVSK